MVSSRKQTFFLPWGVNSVLINLHVRILGFDDNLPAMLSQVPWMKFKVIAEPDFSVFARHPVIRSSFDLIAMSTVKHVTAKFEELMAIALSKMIETVTQSAMEHVEQSLEVLTQNMSGIDANLHETYMGAGYLKSGGQDLTLCDKIETSDFE